jgi:hypothetical protein
LADGDSGSVDDEGAAFGAATGAALLGDARAPLVWDEGVATRGATASAADGAGFGGVVGTATTLVDSGSPSLASSSARRALAAGSALGAGITRGRDGSAA